MTKLDLHLNRAISETVKGRLLIGLYCFFILLTYAVFWDRPLEAISWNVNDDGLYYQHARQIIHWLNGESKQWLGEFHPFLLSKAPLLGMWLALIGVLGIPLQLAEYFLFCLLAPLFLKAVQPLSVSGLGARIVFHCVFTITPYLAINTRILRTNLAFFLICWVAISMVGLILHTAGRKRLGYGWVFSMWAGFIMYYLLREEAIWLLPSLLLVSAYRLFSTWPCADKWIVFGQDMAAVLVGALPLGLVCFLNWQSYGVWETTMRRSDEFIALYSRLVSVRPEHTACVRYIPIERDSLRKAFTCSDALSELKPYLMDIESYWRIGNVEHAKFNKGAVADPQFFASYFEFSLLYAAYQAGYRDPRSMQKFFAIAAQQLALAQETGKLGKRMTGIGLTCSVETLDGVSVAQAWFRALAGFVRQTPLLTLSFKESKGDLNAITDMAFICRQSIYGIGEYIGADGAVLRPPAHKTPEIALGKWRAWAFWRLGEGLRVGVMLLFYCSPIFWAYSAYRRQWPMFVVFSMLFISASAFAGAMALLHALAFPALDDVYLYDLLGRPIVLVVVCLVGICVFRGGRVYERGTANAVAAKV